MGRKCNKGLMFSSDETILVIYITTNYTSPICITTAPASLIEQIELTMLIKSTMSSYIKMP